MMKKQMQKPKPHSKPKLPQQRKKPQKRKLKMLQMIQGRSLFWMLSILIIYLMMFQPRILHKLQVKLKKRMDQRLLLQIFHLKIQRRQRLLRQRKRMRELLKLVLVDHQKKDQVGHQRKDHQ